MDRHTPGPWYEAKAGDYQGLVISESTGENIAVTYRKANARLVAAAPELLAACKARLACDDEYEQGTKEWHDAVLTADEQMRAAIRASEEVTQ